MDALIEALPGRGDDPRSGLVFEADGTVTVKTEFRALEDVWYAGLAFMAHNGVSFILDEVLLTGGVGQRRLQAALNGINLLWVGGQALTSRVHWRMARSSVPHPTAC
ncbi:phosphotransferase-like protein [Ferrimicrobium acidiphilum]|uniref:phosphotransferase-like protein n=1 Tax=Ferrimicrobium acidiphilum TaxID=121039 RepID=UPI0023F13500|nr:hypothetical protein [Ferrimicrobium acidiphilum]